VHLVRDPLPHAGDRAVVVIGVGNAWRGDDAAGLAVARRLRETGLDATIVDIDGELVGIMDVWEEGEIAWVVDAVSSGAAPGTLHRIDVTEEELPRELARTSSHAFGLAESIELARALGRLPARLVVYGIEGASFAAGQEMSAEVAAAVEYVADALREEVGSCTSER
jgi:hydrogenase maturation protease